MTDPGHTTIPVGYVRKAHGIRGDVVVRGMVQDASERLVKGAVFATNDEPPRTVTIVAVANVGGDFRIRIDGVDDRTTAEALRGTQLMISSQDRRDLADGEWWPENLVGCQVQDLEGVAIGELIEVIIAGAQDRLVVLRSDGARAEIPFVEALVPHVDPDAGVISVDLPDGLFE